MKRLTSAVTAALVVVALTALQLDLSPAFSLRNALPEKIVDLLMNPLIGGVPFSTPLTLVAAFLAALWVFRAKTDSAVGLTPQNEVEEGYHSASPEAFEWRRFWRAHIENAQDQDLGEVISPVCGVQTYVDVSRPPAVRSIELKASASQLSGGPTPGPAISKRGRLEDLDRSIDPHPLEDVSLIPTPQPEVNGRELDQFAARTILHEIPQQLPPRDREAHMSDLEQEVVVVDHSMEGELSNQIQPPCISAKDLEKASSVAQTPDLLRQLLTVGRLVYVSPPGAPPAIVRAEPSIAAITTLLEDGRSFCLVGPEGAGKMTLLSAALTTGKVRHLAAHAEDGSTNLLLTLLPERSTRTTEAKRRLQDLLTMVPRLANLGYRYVVIYDLHRLPPEDVQKLVRACYATGALKIAATSADDLSLDGVEMLSRTYSVNDLRWIAFSHGLHRGLTVEQEAEAHLAGYAATRNQADTVEEIVRRLPGGSLGEVAKTIQLAERELREKTLGAFTRPEGSTYKWFMDQKDGVTVAELRQHFFNASKQIDQPGTEWSFRRFMGKLKALGFEPKHAADLTKAASGEIDDGRQICERRSGSPGCARDLPSDPP